MPNNDYAALLVGSSPAGTLPFLCVKCRKLRAGYHCYGCGVALVSPDRLTSAELPMLIAAIKDLVEYRLANHQHDAAAPEEIARTSMQPRGDWGDRTCRTCDRIKVAAYDLLIAMVPS